MSPLDPNTLYSEAGQLFRHYLSWREKLFAGYIAVMAALGVAFKNSQDDKMQYFLIIVGLLMTVVFWLLDYRTNNLFEKCLKAGALLEQNADLNGVFTELSNDESKLTHRRVLNWLFIITITTLTLTYIIFLFKICIIKQCTG